MIRQGLVLLSVAVATILGWRLLDSQIEAANVELPLHGVTLGLDENQGVLTVEVGATVLSFSLSRGSMAEIGRTILDLGASAG